MFYYDGLICPVCGHAFMPEDDIVSCPQCGLPHHRRCWEKEGHCHLEHLHGTPSQWKRGDAAAQQVNADNSSARNICPNCHTDNPQYAEFCRHCGQPLKQNDWQSGYSEYRPMYTSKRSVNYDADEKIDEVSAGDLFAVVNSKQEYYIPRFRKISANQSGGWNWAAFIFYPYWFLYRKMYLAGSLLIGLNLIQQAIVLFIFSKLHIDSYEAINSWIESASSNRIQLLYLVSFWIINGAILLIRFITGAFGNRIYYSHCVKRITRAREYTPDLSSSEMATFGGTSFAIAAIAYVAVYFFTQILSVLIM